MQFRVHNGEYPFKEIPGVIIDAECEEDAHKSAMLMYATKENPHLVVSEIKVNPYGQPGNH